MSGFFFGGYLVKTSSQEDCRARYLGRSDVSVTLLGSRYGLSAQPPPLPRYVQGTEL